MCGHTVTKVSVKAHKQANERVRKTDREREKERVGWESEQNEGVCKVLCIPS